MSSILLQRQEQSMFHKNSGNKPVSFSVLSDTLNEVLSSNIYILSSKGKGLSFLPMKPTALLSWMKILRRKTSSGLYW